MLSTDSRLWEIFLKRGLSIEKKDNSRPWKRFNGATMVPFQLIFGQKIINGFCMNAQLQLKCFQWIKVGCGIKKKIIKCIIDWNLGIEVGTEKLLVCLLSFLKNSLNCRRVGHPRVVSKSIRPKNCSKKFYGPQKESKKIFVHRYKRSKKIIIRCLTIKVLNFFFKKRNIFPPFFFCCVQKNKKNSFSTL